MELIRTGIILAAGRGSRMKEMSLERPKPMTVVNHTTIIDNLIRQLIETGLKRIVVVVGYMAEKLVGHLEEAFNGRVELSFVHNTIYDRTNNIYSLWLAKPYLENGFYLFEADVFCDDRMIEQFIRHAAENIILVGPYQRNMEGTVVELDSDGKVRNMYLKKDQNVTFDYSDKYKTINFYRIDKRIASKFFIHKLEEHIRNEDVNSYYERIIKEAVEKGYRFEGLVIEDEKWWEIDNHDDLEIAQTMFGKKHSS